MKQYLFLLAFLSSCQTTSEQKLTKSALTIFPEVANGEAQSITNVDCLVVVKDHFNNLKEKYHYDDQISSFQLNGGTMFFFEHSPDKFLFLLEINSVSPTIIGQEKNMAFNYQNCYNDTDGSYFEVISN